MAKASRTRPASIQDARTRLRTARAYLEVADLVLAEEERSEMPGVAAALAVLAGIAASDAICASRLQLVHRGDDLRAASDLLQSATPDGKTLAVTLARLIDLKDQAHYGVTLVTAATARRACQWATRLTTRAREECER